MASTKQAPALADRLSVACKKGSTIDPGALVAAASLAAIDAHGRKRFTALHVACDQRRSDVVAALIARGAALSPPGVQGDTPLHVAATRRDAASLRLLLDAGADARTLNAVGESALHAACLWGSRACAALLLDRPDAPAVNAVGSSGRSALAVACRGVRNDEAESLDMVTWLLERGASADGFETPVPYSPTHFACGAKMRRVARLVAGATHRRDVQGLLAAVSQPYLEVAEILLAQTGGASAYADAAAVAFGRAGLLGHVTTCEWVLARWPEVPVRDRAVSELALERSVKWDNTAMVDYLLALGVPAEFTPRRTAAHTFSLLECALMHKRWATVPKLIAHGASTDIQMRDWFLADAPAEVRALCEAPATG